MSKKISCEHSDEQAAQLEAEAKARNVTVSDVLRWSVEVYFNGGEQRQQNMKTLLFENRKTRAALLRRLDMINPPELSAEQLAELLDEAGKDAAAYREERRKP